MRLRQFKKSGIEAFRRFLASCRENPKEPVPIDLLESDEHTTLIEPVIEVESQNFTIKRDAAEYLHKELSALAPDEVRRCPGLWTWLSLMYFNEVCPASSVSRKVRNDYTYIFVPDSMRETYRHILFICWNVLHLSPDHNRLFLHSKISQLDKYTAEVFKRLYLTRIPCIFEVLDRLYWDDESGKPVTGIVAPRNIRPGNLMHRLPTRIRQLEETYDLQSLDADQLLEILGDEFQQRAATSPAQLELNMR